ncbi:MAG: hypothetical protein ACOC0P_07890 [Planctomycetota bacterium]
MTMSGTFGQDTSGHMRAVEEIVFEESSKMIADLKPGDQVEVTVTRTPNHEPDKKTLRRLMLCNTDAQREKDKSLRHRRTRFDPHIRGGRIWVTKPKAARVMLPIEGRSWTMKWRPQLRYDFEAVADLIEVRKV